MSLLFKVSGLLPDKDDKEVMKYLVENANIFFRAGGILTFKDWSELNNTERIAFVTAYEDIKVESNEYALLLETVNKAISKLDRETI